MTSKKSLINYIYSGWYHVIKVKEEDEKEIRKKFNDFFYKYQVMLEDCIAQPNIDSNKINAIGKATKVTMDNMMGQLEANNIMTTRETKDMAIKSRQIELKAQQIEQEANKGKIVVETVQSYEDENSMSKGEIAFLLQGILQENANLSKEDREKIIENVKNNL